MRVTLVGAGPGDRGLITLKGLERIQKADLVLYDRYVSDEILEMIPDKVEKRNVGKHAGNHPIPQEEINRLLLEKAQEGLEVVRLKGGDPFVFGRGGEELELLAEKDIPFEVIPGISSAIAGAAYAGIPVTHRDYASSLHIMTGHRKHGEKLGINFKALVNTRGTLVFLMGVATIGEICEGLLSAGMEKDMPAAIVQSATRSNQRKFLGTVATLPAIADENAVGSPSVIIVGRVCLLSERYDWFSVSQLKPLHGKRIMVTRAKMGETKLMDMLGKLGATVIERPCIKIVPYAGADAPLGKALERIQDYSWLVFTSRFGVNIFFDYLIEYEFDIRALHHLKIACVGPETEKELAARSSIKADYRPDEFNGKALAQGLIALVQADEKLLIARARDGAENLTRILAKAGVSFDDVASYEKTYILEPPIEGDFDFATFTSSSTVEGFVKAAKDMDLSKVSCVCIGDRTVATAGSYGMKVYVAEEATIESMVEAVIARVDCGPSPSQGPQ